MVTDKRHSDYENYKYNEIKLTEDHDDSYQDEIYVDDNNTVFSDNGDFEPEPAQKDEQSRQWDVTVVVSAFVVLLCELLIMVFCIFKLVRYSINPKNFTFDVRPAAWSVLGTCIGASFIMIFGACTSIPNIPRRIYILLCYIYTLLMFLCFVVQAVASSVPFFVYEENTLGGSSILFFFVLFSVNIIINIARLIVITTEVDNNKLQSTAVRKMSIV
ncbi:IL10RB [Acrasis kona]|uniref:IL10RB n=1 Tax=Acrasis kona TaxID=1008807 RepID=A0AAW2Z8K0_9EUKA